VIVRLALAPGEALGELAERRDRARIGVVAVLVTSAAWSGFLATLAAEGHAPSGPVVLPIDHGDYYAWEAAFVWFVHLAMLAVLAGVLHGLGRRLGGLGTFRSAVLVAGLAMALPSLGLWLLPDVVVYLAAGFEAMARAMRYYVPLSVVWTIGLATAGVRSCYGLSTGRAAVVAIVAALAHWMVAGPFLR
jgi:hypothetical protein